MLPQKILSVWNRVVTEVMTGGASLGVYWNRQHLTLVHLRKGFASPEIAHVSHLDLPEEGLEALVPKIK